MSDDEFMDLNDVLDDDVLAVGDQSESSNKVKKESAIGSKSVAKRDDSKARKTKEDKPKKEPAQRGRKCKPKQGVSYTEYAEKDIIYFLTLVEANPMLWDHSIDNSFRNEFKVKTLAEIEKTCEQFMTRGRTHGSVAKDLLQNLITDYHSYCKKIQNAPSGSGSSIQQPFPFYDNMRFLDGASHKREVNNAYIVGSKRHSTLEMQSKEVETPTTELNKMNLTTPKRRKTENDDILRRMDESTAIVGEVLSFLKKDSSCQSKRICEQFEKVVANFNECDRIVAEGKVLQYINSLSAPVPLSQYNYNHPRLVQPHNSYDKERSLFPPFLSDSSSSHPSTSDAHYDENVIFEYERF